MTHTKMGMERSRCGALTSGDPSGRVTDHVLRVAGWAALLQLIWRGREAATFPELIQLYYFLFQEATDIRTLPIVLCTHRFTLYKK